MAKRAADLIVQAVREKPTVTLGLATGSTQIQLYKELIRRYSKQEVDFSSVTTFNLDEYVGLPENHSHSYRYFMDTHFFRHVNLRESNIHMLDGNATNVTAHCQAYDETIQSAGGIDLQILGLGVNAHIAFCEPGTPFDSKTMCVNLHKETLTQNSDGRFYKTHKEVPKMALTMGMSTIMGAKTILMLATGKRKSFAVEKAILCPPSIQVPASILQQHPAATWILEADAASALPASLKVR